MTTQTAGSTSMPTSGCNSKGPAQDECINYGSGNMAIVVSHLPSGQIVHVFSDHEPGRAHVLVTFDERGTGTVTYTNGKPWLVVTMEGWSVSDRRGSITDRGKFPRSEAAPAITCEVNQQVSVEFRDRQHIKLTVCLDGSSTREWQCGEQLRRTESHLNKVTGQRNGRLELDVEQIRQRIATVGSVYVSQGPSHTVTTLPGIGGLKSALDKLSSDSPLLATVQGLQRSDARIKLVDTLPRAVYGTARVPSGGTSGSMGSPMASTRSGDQTHTFSPSSTGASAVGEAGGSTRRRRGGASSIQSSPLLPDFGAPPMSGTQRRMMQQSANTAAMLAGDEGKAKYRGRRARLQPLSLSQLEPCVTGREAPRDVLCVLCIMADFNKVCHRLEPQLQAAAFELQEAAAADPSCPAAHIRLYRLDAAEGRVLQDKYRFRLVPMFLMFYQGQLVYASNDISSKGDLLTATTAALEKGRRGDVLPESFTFAGRDNRLLDSIRPDMSLRT